MIKRGISRLHRVSREIPEAKIINKEEDTCRNYGENDGEIYDEIPAGSNDSTYREDRYIMNYNTSLGYIGLCKMIEAKQEAS